HLPLSLSPTHMCGRTHIHTRTHAHTHTHRHTHTHTDIPAHVGSLAMLSTMLLHLSQTHYYLNAASLPQRLLKQLLDHIKEGCACKPAASTPFTYTSQLA